MKNKNEKDLYIVYTAKLNGEVVYVGSGAYGRESHVNSGCSHVYEINRLHFKGIKFIVEVVDRFETKKESIEVEKSLISQHRPVHNKQYNDDVDKSENKRRLVNQWSKYFDTFRCSKSYKYGHALKFLLDYFGWVAMTEGIDISKLCKKKLPNQVRAILGTPNRPEIWEDMFNLFVKEGTLQLPEKTPLELGLVRPRNKFGH